MRSVIVHPLSSLTSDELDQLLDDIQADPRVGTVELFDTSERRAAGASRTGGDLSARVEQLHQRHGRYRPTVPTRRRDLE